MKYLIIILAFLNVCQAKPGGHSGERVHIRLHMPEVVRQHTPFHKVYKYAKKLPPPPPPAPTHPIIGKPHVSLLGYTTAAAGMGMLSPSIMHLMANTPTITPTLMPNYGPALFDNFNQDFKESATTSTTMRTPTAALGYTAPSSVSSLSSPGTSSAKQKLLEQIFTPNLMAAIKAAAAVQEMNINDDPEETRESLEKNSLLNQNFLDALQREYLSKFGGRRKRKKSHTKSYYHQPRPSQYYNIQNQDISGDDDLSENFEDYPEEQYEEMIPQSQKTYSNDDWNYYRETEPDTDLEDGNAYDSAVAFSGQDNMLSSMPTVDEFLDESSTSGGNKPFYGDLYDSYASTELTGPTSPTSSSSNIMWSQHSPTSWGNSSTRPYRTSPPSRSRYRPKSKVRYVKIPVSTTTTTRKKRKNRFKRYRI
ncbi:uncharacterized protein Dwil_GK13243 [Drosophila willistoni]|uniref:DUF4774 domain-containing protein n=1 Tax=Drosophila willistoni TaxID=7260 RepID=B4NL59_DROWI|nr:uncharacterized protein Dwil_GK13243 [Drosophila willistoni]